MPVVGVGTSGNPLGSYTPPTANSGGSFTPPNAQSAPVVTGAGNNQQGTTGTGINTLVSPGAAGLISTGGGNNFAPYGLDPNGNPYGSPNSNNPNPNANVAGFGALNTNENAAMNYAAGANFTAPMSEADTYKALTNQLNPLIQQITDAYNNILSADQNQAAQDQIAQRVGSALSGQGGSGNASAASSITAANSNAQIAKDQQAKAAALTGIYQQLQSNAISYAQYLQTQANTDATTAIATQQAIAKQGMAIVQQMASQGISPDTLQNNDPQTWAELQQQTGMSSFALTQYMLSSMPAAYQPQSQTTYVAAPDGTVTANTVISTIDPRTGTAKLTTVQNNIPIPYAQFNQANIMQLPNKSMGYINSNGQVIDLSTGKQYIPVTAVPQGSALLNPTTGGVVGTGEPNTTVVPLTSGTVQSGPPVGTSGTTGTSGTGTGGTTGGTTAQNNPLGTSGSTSAPSSGSGNYKNGLEVSSTGTPTASWNSLASLPGVTNQQLSFLKTTFASPQEAYNQGIQWILNGGSSSSSGSSMGTGGIKIVNSNVASSIGTGILESYGLTQQDANTISEVDSGLSSSLTTMIGRQATVNQYIQKSRTQAQILNDAIAKYGENGASPLVNSVIQAFQKNIYSDPSFNSMQVALGTFLKDYARISDNATGSGAATTDASNASAAEKLSTLMSQGSLQAALSTMWDEMNAQVSSLNTSVTGLQNSLSNIIQNYAASKNQASGASNMDTSASTTSMANPTGQVIVNTPEGNFYFPTQAAADSFKKAAGL
jgi:hypothetical protein